MDSQETRHTKLLRLCRACMHDSAESIAVAAGGTVLVAQEASQQWHSIFETVAECGLQIAEMFTTTTPKINVQLNDGLPQKICWKCFEQLLNFHKFQEMCFESEKEMRKLLNISEIKNILVVTQDDEKTTRDVMSLPGPTSLSADSGTKLYADPLQIFDNVTDTDIKKEQSKTPTPEGQTIFKMDLNDNNFEILEEAMAETALLDNEANTLIKVEILPLLSEDHTVADYYSNDSDWDDIPLHKLKRKTSSMNAKQKDAKMKQSTKSCTGAKTKKKTFPCTQCEQVFIRKKFLKRHLQEHHTTPSPTPNAEGKISEEPQRDANGELLPVTFDCDLCPKKFESRRSLTTHKHVHSGKVSLKTNKPTTCEYCNKKFQHYRTLKDHLRTHTGEQPYLCSDCGKTFHSQSNLKTHLLSHDEVKRYECPECPKKFSTGSSLSSHKAVHSAQKPHICDQCGAAFIKAYELKRHKFYHTGEKPFKCGYCKKGFARAYQMRRHMLTHTGEKPYKCKYCDRAFVQSNDCIKHLRSHLGDNVYRCELCPSAFRLASELRKHFTLHKNEDEETREKNKKALMEEGRRFGLNISQKQSTAA